MCVRVSDETWGHRDTRKWVAADIDDVSRQPREGENVDGATVDVTGSLELDNEVTAVEEDDGRSTQSNDDRPLRALEEQDVSR